MPIAGIVKKWGGRVGVELVEMGRILSHGLPARCLVALPGQAYWTTLEKLNPSDVPASSALLQIDLERGTYPRVLTAETPLQIVSDADNLARERLCSFGRSGFELNALRGSFALAFLEDNAVRLARDPVGARPIYIGERADLYVFATEMKALWRIGASVLGLLKPGQAAVVEPSGCSMFRFSTLRQVEPSLSKIEECSPPLIEILTATIQMLVKGFSSLGILFSGGIDSSIIAAIAKQFTTKIRLFVSGLDGSSDLSAAENTAAELGAPLSMNIIAETDVESIARRATYEAEVHEPMHIALAIALGQACSAASDQGYPICLAGQGCDEQFGGYDRYRKASTATSLVHKLNQGLWNDILQLGLKDLPRDYTSAASRGIVLELPFLNTEFIEFAMHISPRLKVFDEHDRLRKHPIREAARRIGISSLSSNRPKKAAQFGSDLEPHLRLLAKERGLSVRSYCRRLAEEAYREELGTEPSPSIFLPPRAL